jgi:hypothetical protein
MKASDGGHLTDIVKELDWRKRRRSRRIHVRVRILVRIQVRDKEPVAEETDALVVNAHGALIILAADVKRDQFITISNVKTNEELLARVTSVGLRFMGKAQVGIEFIRPAPEFWGIPHPKDWDSASHLHARGPVPQKP